MALLAARLAKTFTARSHTFTKTSFRALNHNKPCVSFFSTKYTPSHEYVIVKGEEATIGITDFAQNQLGDVVYVDLPSVGHVFTKGDIFGAVESVKAASDVYAPVAGKVTAVNEELAENPHLVNEEAMGKGWFIKLELENKDELNELLDEAAYKEHCENEEH